jgi:uncharacterized protein YlxW (UPF0749 family)
MNREPASLFVEITTITVDPAYVEAAGRHAMLGPAPRRTRLANAVAFVVALALAGMLGGVAARQTRLRAPAAARLRQALVDETARRTATSDRLRRQADALRTANATARGQQLRTSDAGRRLAERLDRLELAAGGYAVTGRGIEVRLADGPPSAEGAGDDGRIRDVDLQQAVNALWAAGAEAIAINGQRLSALTAIREAGEAILVDYRPLSPPYVVAAIGDPDLMEPAFSDSAAARRFRTWEEVFGLTFSVARRDSLSLPAAETTRLRHAMAGAS